MRTILACLLFALPISAGEPVPEGALLRLGTTRFRADGLLRLFYTKDDMQIVGCTPTSAVIWDADSGVRVKEISFGKATPDEPIAFQQFAYDAARHRLAGLGIFEGRYELHGWNLAAGAVAFAEKESPGSGLEWTPDGRLVHMMPNGSGVTVGVRNGTGAVVHSWSTDGTDDLGATLGVIDDTRLLTMKSNGRAGVRELATGKELAPLVDMPVQNRYPLLAATPDGKYVAVGGQQQCEIFETATYTKVGTVTGDMHSPGHRLFLSPDGKTVYYNTLDKEGFDVATGKPVFDIRLGHASGGMVEALSHDGRRMICHVAGRPVVYQVDTKTGLEVADHPGHETRAEIVWLPGGKNALIRAPYETAWALWNLDNGRREHLFEVTDLKGTGWRGGGPVALSPDGKEVIDFDRSAMHEPSASAFNWADGKVSRKLFPQGHALYPQTRMAYDAARQSVLAWDGRIGGGRVRYFTWWNLAGDRRESGFDLEAFDPYVDWVGMAGSYLATTSTGNRRRNEAADSQPYPNAVRLHRPSDGRLYRVLELPDQVPAVISCPPGRELLLTEGKGDTPLLHLWDTAAGRVISSYPKPPDLPLPALPPSGNYFVHGEADGFAVFEPYVAKRVITRVKVPAAVESFSFSPDGTRLATVLADTTIVVWNTAAWNAAVTAAVAERMPADLATLTDDLADEPGKAHAAMRFLTVAGARAIPVLKGIAPPKPADAELVRRAIADLDAARYAVREKASKDLAALGTSAEAAIRTALATKPNAEVKSRLEKLAAHFDHQVYDPETLRAMRAAQIIRDISTPQKSAE